MQVFVTEMSKTVNGCVSAWTFKIIAINRNATRTPLSTGASINKDSAVFSCFKVFREEATSTLAGFYAGPLS